MAKFCLLPQKVQEFKKALASREIDPAKLNKMTSEERRNFLAKYVGKDNAVQVNSLFESKLLLKNIRAGYIAWAKKVAGITPEIRRDLLAKIEKLDRVLSPQEEQNFLQDLASTRLGLEITEQEAKKVNDLSQKIVEARKDFDIKTNKWKSEEKRLEYGYAKVDIENYINDLKLKAKSDGVVDKIIEAPGIFKSIQTSLDNSFFGRQGIKILYNNPVVWTKAFIKSWGDIKKELGGQDAIRAIKADIYSRPNAINNKYKTGGYGLDVLSEEAYPSSLPSRIPLLGRLFKASESAYNGAALRIRADLADRFIELAEKNYVNTLRKDEAKYIGNLVGSLTGRGSLGKLDVLSREANVLFYSVKFLKSNIDTLFAPFKYIGQKTIFGFDNKGAEFASKQAAKSSIRIIGTIALVLATAKFIDPDSVDEDPTSTNFGKIKIFGKWTDITGGMGAILRLAARIALRRSKSATGKITDYNQQSFGARSLLDEIESFIEGKFSPIAGIGRDWLEGKFFDGEDFTIEKAIKRLILPLPVQNALEIIKDPKSEFVFASILLDALGFSVSTIKQSKIDWNKSMSLEMQEFKKKVGVAGFNKANEDFNRVYDWWQNDIENKESYKKLSQDAKDKLKTQAKTKIKKMIFKANNFQYKKPKATKEEKNESEKIKELLP